MSIFRPLGDFMWKVYRRVRRHLSEKQLIIIISTVIAAVAVTLFFVFKKSSVDTVTVESGHDISVAGDMAGGAAVYADADDEEMPVVEAATEGTKVESTEDTTVLAKKDGAKEGYLNRCVFLGDSRTVAMVNYGFFNDDAALAQIGISHPSFEKNTFVNNAGKEYTLKSYLESHQAPVIYIALGVNGINDPSEEHYKETFLTLIDHIAEMAPNSNIVLMAIGPVDDNGTYKKTVQNSWIDKYNAFLLDTAKEKHIFYLDITEILKGDNGQVKAEYDAGDGLHYSGSGCEAIFNYIVEHPVPGVADDGEYIVKYIKPDPNRTKVTMDDGSGIDEDKLQELMNMMMDGAAATTTDKTATSATDAASQQAQQEEASRRAAEEEERRKKEQEEAERKAREQKKASEEEAARKAAEASKAEEARKAAAEEEARKAAEEEAARKKAEEEAARKAAEEEAARKAAEEEAERKAAEEEAARKAAEEEAAKKDAEEAARQAEEARRAEEEEKARQAAAEEAQHSEDNSSDGSGEQGSDGGGD